MKKALIVGIAMALLLVVLTMGCSKDESTEPEPPSGYKRTAIIEFFTFHHCTNCPLAEAALDSIYGIHGDSLAVIEYHLRTTSDTLSPCTTFVNNRKDLYGIISCPTVEFDGVEEVEGASGDLFATYSNILEARFSNSAPFRVDNFNCEMIGTASVSFDFKLTADTDMSAYWFIVLTEDGIVQDDHMYNHVARQVFPSDTGQSFSINAGTPYNSNGSIGLGWIPGGLVRAILFVQNLESGEIYQGAMQSIGQPYAYSVAVSPDTSQAGTPGETSVFTFSIDNTGIIDDDYLIHASEVATVYGWGWMMCTGGGCKLPDHGHIYDTLTVPSQLIDTFTVEIIPNDSAGTEQINVHIVSAGDSTLTESFNINVHIP